jgi:hypothetical protein
VPIKQEVSLIDIASFIRGTVNAKYEDHVILKIFNQDSEMKVLRRLLAENMSCLIDDLRVEWHPNSIHYHKDFESSFFHYKQWLSTIPLHFVYVNPMMTEKDGENHALEKAKQVAQGWVDILPLQYKIFFWSDAEVRLHFPELVDVLSKIPVASWMSDVLRYQIILRYGGVYLDTDTVAVHDFTPLLNSFNNSFTVCQTPWQVPDGNLETTYNTPCESIANGMIAAPALHPVVKCAAEHSWAYSVRAVAEGTQGTFNQPETGPPRWTSCVKSYSENLMAVLPSWTFLPCSFFSRGSCNSLDYQNLHNVYGMHEWAWSWQ